MKGEHEKNLYEFTLLSKFLAVISNFEIENFVEKLYQSLLLAYIAVRTKQDFGAGFVSADFLFLYVHNQHQ